MTDAAGGPPAPGPWQLATVEDVRSETASAKTLSLATGRTFDHLAGQHLLVRLTAPDGYRATRSYSIASAPGEPVEVTVERLEGGEVSPHLHDVVAPGDELEVRGPIGGWFVWRADSPALLVGGGSGLVPLRSMLRLARRSGRADLVRLVVSVRSPDDLYYRDELVGPEVTVAYTREAPPGAARPPGRLTAADLPPLGQEGLTAYVCGSSAFVEHVGPLLLDAGLDRRSVRVERFGPTS